MISLLMLMFLAFIFSGCATNSLYLGKTLDIKNENDIVVIPIDQPQLVLASIPMIDFSSAQEIVFECPEKLLEKEYRLFRISWPLVAIDYGGNVYWGIFFINLKEKSPNNKLYCHGKIFVPQRHGFKWMILSTRAVMGYNIYEEFTIDKEKFQIDIEYRKRLFYEKAVPLENTKDSKVFEDIIKKWNRFRTPFGDIQTPYEKEIVKALAVKFTGYTAPDRKNRDSRDIISINPVGMGIAKVNDIFQILWGKTTGWDMDSEDEMPQITRADLDFLKREAKIVRY